METRDLLIRSWRPEDEEPYNKHCNTDDVMLWLGGRQTRTQLRADIAWFSDKERDFGTTFWVVVRKADQEFLGWCGLVVLETGDEGVPTSLIGELEIGWRFRSDVHGHGYAKQAAIAVLDYAFDTLRAERVISIASRGNTASWGLMHRIGMRHAYGRDYGAKGNERNLVYVLEARDWDMEAVIAARPPRLS